MNKKRGFTLIELLSVVLILGILTAIALPQYQKAIQRADAANALVTLKTVFDSAKRYYASSSQWPVQLKQLDIELLDAAKESSSFREGEFQYTFTSSNRSVSACRIVSGEGQSYCLTAYYRDPSTQRRDAYKCRPTAQKFVSLCASLCTNTGDSAVLSQECTIE